MIKGNNYEIIKTALKEGRKSLLEHEAKAFLKRFGIPMPESIVVNNVDEADVINAANMLGYPVVIKVISSGILHKTEAGGVRVGLNNEDELKDAFNEMRFQIANAYPDAELFGFLVEKMVKKGIEIIIGGVKDEQFGAAVMFGIGGIMVEIMKDVSFRLAPVTKEECLEMFQEIKAYPLLRGYRGYPSANLDIIADYLIKIGNIINETDNIKEIEINPLIAYHNTAIAVDVRILLL